MKGGSDSADPPGTTEAVTAAPWFVCPICGVEAEAECAQTAGGATDCSWEPAGCDVAMGYQERVK